MADERLQPPWDFFHDASIASLQSFELSRLNNAANLRRQIAALLDQWVSDNSQALMARWVREQRALPQPSSSTPEMTTILSQSALPFAPSAISAPSTTSATSAIRPLPSRRERPRLSHPGQ